MKKLATILFALLMLFGTLTACQKPGGNGDGTTTQAETKPANPYVQEDGLPAKDYDGQEFVFLTATEITGGEMTVMDTDDTTDPLVSSIHYRTQFVEERFDVDVTDNRQPYATTYNTIYASVNAQDDAFDACYGFITWMFPLALQNCFAEFTDIPYVDLSKEWWDQSAKEAFSIGNRLFYMTGDANMFYNDYTWVLYFNKQILKDINEDEPYDLVENGEWTIDKMLELGTKAIANLDGQEGTNYGADRMGMVTHQYTAYALAYGCNELFFAKDEEDLPIITYDSERLQDVCEKVATIFSTDGFMYDTTAGNGDGSGIEETFGAGRALFCGEVLQCARRYRGMETDFGILPYPKYDTTQKDYVTYSLEMVYPVGVPSHFSGADLEMAGIILEALHSASRNSVVSAYFDAALTSNRFLRDERSEDMLEIIFRTRCFPLATMKDFGGTVSQLMYSARTNAGGYSSFIASNTSRAQGEIDQLIKDLDKLN